MDWFRSEINDRYDNPDAYDADEAYDRRGRYPPDWERRRKVIWNQQKNECGRCGRSRDNVEYAAVHHIQPLSKGGSNSLDNLVGLCSDCHLLIHPDNTDLPGVLNNAPVFPALERNSRVAVVRDPSDRDGLDEELMADLRTLERITSRPSNHYAYSYATLNIPTQYGSRLPDDIKRILTESGLIAKSSDYSHLILTVQLQGLRGILSRYIPSVEIHTEGAIVRVSDWSKSIRTRQKEAYIGEDASSVELVLKSAGEIRESRCIELNNSAVHVELQLSKPPILNS